MTVDPVGALRAECELVSELVLTLPEEDFAKPTRLPAWNFKELLAHLHRGILRIEWGLDEPPPPAADADSVSYWRRYDPQVDGDDIARRATELASEFGSGPELAGKWDETWRRATNRAADTGPERVVATWGPALTLADLVRTRVLEATVHRADLGHALGLPPDPTEDGLTVTEEILLALLDAPPPRTVPISGIALMEAGTGRRELTAEERQALGHLAARFPVLS